MDSSILVNLKSPDIEQKTIIGMSENNVDINRLTLNDPASWDFYEYFSSSVSHPESFLNEDDDLEIMHESSKSVYSSSRFDEFKSKCLNYVYYTRSNESSNHHDSNNEPKYSRGEYYNDFFNYIKDDLPFLDSSYFTRNNDHVNNSHVDVNNEDLALDVAELNYPEMEQHAWLEDKSEPRLQSTLEKQRAELNDKLDEKQSVDQILSREYYRSKAEYQLEQKSCIAAVHFKISILSDSFHKWRMYTISKNVKMRMMDVARVHYSDTTSANYFKLWKNRFKEKCKQQQKVNNHILARAFKVWKICSSSSKQINLEKFAAAVEFNKILILKQTFHVWKEKYFHRKADSCYQSHKKRHIFKLWSLQLLKRKLQRRLARSHYIRLCQRKFFTKWKERAKDICCRRYLFKEKLHIFMLRFFWERFRSGVLLETEMRSNAASIDTLCKQNSLRYFFSSWKHQYEIECFKTRHEERDEKLVLRIYFEKWNLKRRKLVLLRRMELWNIIGGKLMLLQYFSKWQNKKLIRIMKNREYEESLGVVQQNNLARSFYTWQSRYDNEIKVKSFNSVIQRNKLGRCFKLWILSWRQTELFKMQQMNVKKQMFLYWKNMAKEKVDVLKRKYERENNILRKCISHWEDYISISKQHRDASVENFARHWLDLTQQRMMERRIAQAEEASDEIIKKVHFSKWQHQFNTALRRRLKMEEVADEYHYCHIYSTVFSAWLRQQHISINIRNYRREKEKLLLATAFKQWLQVIQHDMKVLLSNFAEKLTVSENSSQNDIVNNPQWYSPRLNNTLSKNSVSSLVNLYKDSLESSLQQQNDSLQLEIDTSLLDGKLILSDNGSHPSLLVIHKGDQSCASYPSLIFSPSDINDFSSAAYNAELLDYNTDNDVDQDQIFADPTSHSELPLNFSSQTTISEDNFMRSCNFSFMSSNMHIPRSNNALPKWIDLWKKRHMHSKILSKQKRYSYDDVTAPPSTSLLLSLSGTLKNQRNLQLSLSVGEEGDSPKGNLDQRKLALLVATLNYWKHLDISAVFYAWLEYTQRKKYLRLMQVYLMEKKQKYQLHSVFLMWNRKVYSIQVLEYFRQKTLMNRYFGQWLRYHFFQELKYLRMEKAKEQYSKSSVRLHFQEWKRKCRVEFLLNGVNNSLDNDLDVLLNDFSLAKDKQMLENFFLSWKYSTLQAKLATIHFDNKLLLKFLNVWQLFVLERRRNKMKLNTFQGDHQLKKAFLLWKRRMHHQICAQNFVHAKQTEVNSLVISRWHEWARMRFHEKEKEKSFMLQVNHRWLKAAFKEWKECKRQKLCASEHYNYLVCAKIFSSWRDITNQRVAGKNRLKVFQSKSMKRVMLKTYVRWKEVHDSKVNLQRDEDTLSITFKAWKESTLHSRADRRYVDNQCKHVFKSWKERYISRNEIQFLAKISCRRWKRFVQKSRKNENILEAHLQQKNLLIKRQYFLEWRKKTQVLMTSKHHADRRLLRLCLFTWIQSARKHAEINTKIQDYIVKKQGHMLKRVILKWREYKTDSIQAQKLEEARCLIATKHFNHHLVKQFFHAWNAKIGFARLKKMRHQVIARKYFERWRNNIYAHKMVVSLFEQKRCELYWHKWRIVFAEQQVLKVMKKREERRILSMVFASWNKYARLKHTLPNRMQNLQTSKWFCKWKNARIRHNIENDM